MLFGKLFQQIRVWCVKISVNMSRCVNYLCKKENHARVNVVIKVVDEVKTKRCNGLQHIKTRK